jgi:ABC-2 type transport system ATP-binding protein
MTPPLLEVCALRKRYGKHTALDGVSFQVPAGAVFGLLGPNGAGKTTTMRMILGIFPPDGGAITWNGEPVTLATRRRFGYLPEERGLYGKMRVRDQIAYFARLHGCDAAFARDRTTQWMERLDIMRYADRPCSELSKGNQQKVQLASAAVHEPELLVLDEPFSGLDPVNAEIMLASIRALAENGTTLVLSSHQMFQIENACSAFCIIGAGEVRAAGTLAQLRENFPTRTIVVDPDLPEIRSLFARIGATQSSAHASLGALAYQVPAATDFAALLRSAADVGPVQSFERREPSLGDIYVRAQGTDEA